MLCCGLFCTAVACGQSLTLDTCLTLAVQNEASLQNARIDVETARMVKKQAFTKYFPNVSATALGYYAMHPLVEYGIDDIDNAMVRHWLQNLYMQYGRMIGLPDAFTIGEKGFSVGATVVQPLFMGGQIVQGNRLAQVGVEAAQQQYLLQQQRVLLQTEQCYWMVLSLQSKKQTLEEAILFVDTLYRDVTVAQEAGLLTRNEELKVALKRTELQSDLLRVNNGIVMAKRALCQLVGVPYSEGVQLTDTVNRRPLPPDSLYVEAGAAVANRPESRLLELQSTAARIQQKMSVGEALPHVLVGAGASYGSLLKDEYSTNGLVFATVQVPLTAWWETAYKQRTAALKFQAAENDRKDLSQKMLLETEHTWDNLREQYAQVTLAAEMVAEADANQQSVLHNYLAGLVPVSDLLEAQTLYRQALDQQMDKLIDYQITMSRYKQISSR